VDFTPHRVQRASGLNLILPRLESQPISIAPFKTIKGVLKGRNVSGNG
jgi:hypothetical protein